MNMPQVRIEGATGERDGDVWCAGRNRTWVDTLLYIRTKGRGANGREGYAQRGIA